MNSEKFLYNPNETLVSLSGTCQESLCVNFKEWKQKPSFSGLVCESPGILSHQLPPLFQRRGYASVSCGNSHVNPGKEHDIVFSSYLWKTKY